MSDNPYAVTPAAATATDVTSVDRCPELNRTIQTTTQLDPQTAVELMDQCTPVAARDPKTGKRPIQIVFRTWKSRAILVALVFLLFWLTQPHPVANDSWDSILYWTCSVGIPVFISIYAVLYILRFHRKSEQLLDSLARSLSIELKSQDFTVHYTHENGEVWHNTVAWKATQIRASEAVWLLNQQSAPVLIMKEHLTPDEVSLLTDFFDDLVRWQAKNIAQLQAFDSDYASHLPHHDTESLSFTMDHPLWIESARRAWSFRSHFPEQRWPDVAVPSVGLVRCLAVANAFGIVVHPAWRLGQSADFSLATIFVGAAVTYVLHLVARNSRQATGLGISGVIGEDEMWFCGSYFLGHGKLSNYRENAVCDDLLLVGIKPGGVSLVIPKAAFAESDAFDRAQTRLKARSIVSS